MPERAADNRLKRQTARRCFAPAQIPPPSLKTGPRVPQQAAGRDGGGAHRWGDELHPKSILRAARRTTRGVGKRQPCIGRLFVLMAGSFCRTIVRTRRRTGSGDRTSDGQLPPGGRIEGGIRCGHELGATDSGLPASAGARSCRDPSRPRDNHATAGGRGAAWREGRTVRIIVWSVEKMHSSTGVVVHHQGMNGRRPAGLSSDMAGPQAASQPG